MVLGTQNEPQIKSTQKMLPRNRPDRIRIALDDTRLVANAGLLLPATLALHLGLRPLVDRHLDQGDAPGRANTGRIASIKPLPNASGCLKYDVNGKSDLRNDYWANQGGYQ